jgi:copper chaperone
MEKTNFKTNIKCAACVEKVTPGLNETVGEGNWKVDISNPEKVLTVEGEINEAKLKEALQKVGYKAERQ